MTLTRKSLLVSVAGLLIAWGGLTLAWMWGIDAMNPIALVPVVGGTALIFLPAVLQIWSEDRKRVTDRTALAVRIFGIAAGMLVGGGILYLRTISAGDPKLQNVLSPVLATMVGIVALTVFEKAALAVLARRKEK